MSTRPRFPYRFTALEILSIVMGVHLSSSAGAPAPEVRFVDATQTAGIEFEHRNSATPSKYLLETMGGGVALLDYDNDGRLDIFFTNGAKLDDQMVEGKLPDKADPAFWNRLYRQTGAGTFVDVTQKAGVSGAAQNQYGMGVAVGDYDNDGLQDIYVTNFGRNTLYRNAGDGTFADVTDRARVQGGGWSASAGFFDLRQRREARPVRHPLPRLGLPEEPLLRGEEARLPGVLPPGQLRSGCEYPVSQQRRRHVHRRVVAVGHRGVPWQRAGRRVCGLRR